MRMRRFPLTILGTMLASSGVFSKGAVAEIVLPDARPIIDQTPMRDIFTPASDRTLPPDLGPSVVEAAMVNVDFDKIRQLGRNRRAEIGLLPRRAFTLNVLRRDQISASRYTFRGKVEGFELAQFAGSVVDDALAMSIRVADRGLFIMVRRVADGRHLVSVIDESKLERCDRSPRAPQAQGEEFEESTVISPQNETEPQNGPCTAPSPIWDMAVIYTDDARAAAGGTAAIESLIQLFIEEANMTYENSLINGRLRMVYLGEENYDEANDMDVDLDRLTGKFDAHLANVHTIREDYYADSVMLLINDAPGCGLAWCCSTEGNAFGVSEWDCWGATFVHEFGHNQGCAHNEEDADCGGCYNYARGWYFNGNDGVQYGTQMSYIGQRFWHFSNPNVFWKGQPVGVADQAENARAINNRAIWVEGFRLTHFEVWVDFDYLFGTGTYSSPLRTVVAARDFLVEGQNPSELPTMNIKAGTTNEIVTIDKPMVIEACGGMVVIGQQ